MPNLTAKRPYKNRPKFDQQWINVPIRNRSATGKPKKNIEMEQLTQAIAHACYVPGRTICLSMLSNYPVTYIQWVTSWVIDAQRSTQRLATTYRPGRKTVGQESAYCEKCKHPNHLNSRNVFYCCYCRHETRNTGQGT